MIKHVVFFKFKPGVTDREKEGLAYELEMLANSISQIKSILVAPDIGQKNNSYDLALDTSFDSMEDVETYAAHPAHVKVLETIGKLCQTTAKVDYETD
ncbi:MAG: Dabb family protein [Nitrospinota bacterium]|nr:Dabb family protein [Nitrospinota bacterium]